MKIVAIGGSGLIGTKVVHILTEQGHEALAFFEHSGRHLAHAEREAGVRHHVALSVVGTDRLPDNGYFRAKLAQERLIKTSGIPYTIIRAQGCIDVLEGSVVMPEQGGTAVALTPGRTCDEGPDDGPVVGRNASPTRSAIFWVLLVKDQGAPTLVPVK